MKKIEKKMYSSNRVTPQTYKTNLLTNMSSLTIMPVVRIDEAAIRESYVDVIIGYLASTGVFQKDARQDVVEFVSGLMIEAPARKAGGRRKKSPEEIEEAERVKREKKEARDAERAAKKEAKAEAKLAAKAAKAAEKAAKAAEKGEWFTPKRLNNPDGGEDPRGTNGSFLRYKIHRTSGEVKKVKEENWTDEASKMLEVLLSKKKAVKPDMMKAVKAVAKKQASPKKSAAAAKKEAKKEALKKKALEAKKAKSKAKEEALAKQRAETLAKAKAEAEAKAAETKAAEDEIEVEDIELDEEAFEEFDEDTSRTPFTWDKHPEMELWEDEDKWVWDGQGEDANPICYYDEEDGAYVSAPGNEDLLA